MSEYLSEEEQINRLAEWWGAYGTQVLLAVGVLIAGIVGWGYYTGERQQTIEAGTALYAQYLDAAEAEEKQALARQIKREFPGSGVQTLVALAEAKEAVSAGDLVAAQTALTEARDTSPDALLGELASLRLAKVQYALGEAAAALVTLQSVRSAGYLSLAQEMTGDIHLAEGDTEQAYGAYLAAIDNREAGGSRVLLEIKRDNAAPVNGTFTTFAKPLDQALEKARETLATDEINDSDAGDASND